MAFKLWWVLVGFAIGRMWLSTRRINTFTGWYFSRYEQLLCDVKYHYSGVKLAHYDRRLRWTKRN